MKTPYNVLRFSEDQQDMIHFFNRFAEVIDIGQSNEVEQLRGWLVKNVEIFKAGTWRGVLYTEDDIQEMVDNFKTLKDSAQFDPVFKKNHSENVEDQVGWIYDVRKDGDLLLADIHITDWGAQDKIRDGTWKNLSSEIYPPALAVEEFGIEGHVLRGVAIVSVPKVKGLKGIVLNSEILENEGGNIVNREQLEALLKKIGKFSEEEIKGFSDEEIFAKFSEHVTTNQGNGQAQAGAASAQGGAASGQPGQVQNFGEGQFVVMKQEDILALAQGINQKDQANIDLFAEIATLKAESKTQKNERKIEALMKAGKVTPAEKAGIVAFSEKIEGAALDAYFQTLEDRAPVAEFGEIGGGQGGTDEDEDVKKALAFFSEQRKTYE